MRQFVLDTSLFTNPDVHAQFAEDALEGIRRFLALAHTCPAEFYMPGSVYQELRNIKALGALEGDFESVVRIRSPRRFSLMVPSELIYELIDDLRGRIDKGLRIAEELTREAHGGSDPGRLINRLRDRYREALRQGVIDSREDVDVLLLAYEMEAVLVSADGGLATWADKVGIQLINPRNLRCIMENLAGAGR